MRRFTRPSYANALAVLIRKVSVVVVLLAGCRHPAPPAPLPDVTVGTMEGDKGIATFDFDKRGSFQIDYAARPTRSCVTGVHIHATQAATGCTLTVGHFEVPSAKPQRIEVPLGIECVDGDRRSSSGGNVVLTCAFTEDASSVRVEGSAPTLTTRSAPPIVLAPLVSPADRTVLVKPITFAKKSAVLTPDMGALVVQKAKVLETNTSFDYGLTGSSEEIGKMAEDRELAEKRVEAVARLFEGRAIEKSRMTRGYDGGSRKLGNGVFFEVRLP